MSAHSKAHVLTRPAVPLSEYEIKTVPIPKLRDGQLLVKVEAAALNPVDWKIHYQWSREDSYPLTLGADGSGVVEDIGSDVLGFKKGDRIIFQTWTDEETKVNYGTFQQYIVVPTYVVAKIPSTLSFAEAAPVLSCAVTIAISLYSHKPGTDSLRLSPPWEGGAGQYAGKSFFVPGGATNVGQYAIQFAKLSGFSPIIATASLHNTDLLKSFGATHVIDRKLPSKQIIEEVKSIAGGPVDLAYDAISEEETLQLSIAVLRHGGQLVSVLPGKGEYLKPFVEEKALHFAAARGLLSAEINRGALASFLDKLPELLEQGLIKPVPYEVLPGGLHGVSGGLERLKNNQVSAVKLVVLPPETA